MPPFKIDLNDFLYKSTKTKIPTRENQNTHKGDNKNTYKKITKTPQIKGTTKTR